MTPNFPRTENATVADSQYRVNCGTCLYHVEKSDIVAFFGAYTAALG